jgi:hypothetical protein
MLSPGLTCKPTDGSQDSCGLRSNVSNLRCNSCKHCHPAHRLFKLRLPLIRILPTGSTQAEAQRRCRRALKHDIQLTKGSELVEQELRDAECEARPIACALLGVREVEL